MRILVINPGSTSTKIAVYNGAERVMQKNVSHSAEDLAKFPSIIDQLQYRKEFLLKTLQEEGQPLEFDAIMARGPLSKPVEGGTYLIDDEMLEVTRNATHHHACNLGCLLAKEISDATNGCPGYVADPVVTDELCDYARVSGSPLMPRISIWHALNQRAIARRYAKDQNKRYEDLNLIVCHLGGGISVAAHEHGRAIDVNNALDGEGPFSPERAGTLPANDLIHLCFSGEYTEAQLLKLVAGKAGLTAHLGTNNMRDIEARINEGDERAKFFVDAMIYHIAKAIAAQGAVLYGKVDAIILTGGIAYWKYFVDELRKRVDFLAPVVIYPGEDEMEALALNALAVVNGEMEAKTYSQIPDKAAMPYA